MVDQTDNHSPSSQPRFLALTAVADDIVVDSNNDRKQKHPRNKRERDDCLKRKALERVVKSFHSRFHDLPPVHLDDGPSSSPIPPRNPHLQLEISEPPYRQAGPCLPDKRRGETRRFSSSGCPTKVAAGP
ncbi:hypothetical protein OF83DRAFT_889824 [Amylostereum chailletii]|nr:hypothetical protein OF83DRAFT_889824 [Amylostereum chailletii]